MRKKVMFLGMFIAIALFEACSKSKDPEPTPSILGFWVGKYGNSAGAANADYAFLFKADGSLKVYANDADTSKATKAVGTYFISGTKITASYTYPGNAKYSAAATADVNFKTLSGTWGSGTSTTGNTFFMNKQ